MRYPSLLASSACLPSGSSEWSKSSASSPGIIFCTFLKKLLTYCAQYDIIIDRKEVNALSKRKKKRGNKAEPDSYLNLVTAILNLVIAILLLIEKLTE